MGGSPSPPPAPDYAGAAQATAASNQQQNTAATWANRPNMNTPWGSSSWTAGHSTDPSSGLEVTNWTNNVQLTPEQQAALTQQQNLQSGLSTAAGGLLGQATASFNKPWDTSGMTGMYNAGGPAHLDTSGGKAGPQFGFYSPNSAASSTAGSVGATGQQTSVANNASQLQQGLAGPGGYNALAMQAIQQRQQPLLDRQTDMLKTQLANQGIQQGSAAYTNAMRDNSMSVNDANLGAITAGFNQGNTEWNQGLQGGQFHNAAVGQGFGQGLQQGQFTNEALNSQFNQAATSANVQNQAAQINNQNRQFNAEQGLAAANQNNSWMQQGYQNANNQYLQGNQAAANQQSLNTDYSNLTQQQRQQQLQEAQYTRNLPLNQMSALLNGQQVQSPQFTAPNATAGTAVGTNYSGAMQAQNQYNMGMYNSQVGAANSQQAGMYGLAGTAVTAAVMF